MSGTWPWIIFNAFVLLMLAINLGIFHRQSNKVSFKEANYLVGSVDYTGNGI